MIANTGFDGKSLLHFSGNKAGYHNCIQKFNFRKMATSMGKVQQR
jgi:hypothetical protein